MKNINRLGGYTTFVGDGLIGEKRIARARASRVAFGVRFEWGSGDPPPSRGWLAGLSRRERDLSRGQKMTKCTMSTILYLPGGDKGENIDPGGFYLSRIEQQQYLSLQRNMHACYMF